MIYMTITRRCGHEEQIGIAGSYGDFGSITKEKIREINTKYETDVEKNIQEQKDKLCLPCLKTLSKEDQRKEMAKHE